jgi:hypothetical protein
MRQELKIEAVISAAFSFCAKQGDFLKEKANQQMVVLLLFELRGDSSTG